MQYKIIGVPVVGGDQMNDLLNAFLRSHRVVKISKELISEEGRYIWVFCIEYIDDRAALSSGGSKEKKDYKSLLPEKIYNRYLEYKEIRRQLAEANGLPPYAVFTNEELSLMAKKEQLETADLRNIEGIGQGKAERWGHYFIQKNAHATKQQPDAEDSGL